MEDRLLVLQPGIRAVPLRWESQFQDTGPQESSQLHVLSNSENLPEISISTPRPSSSQWPAIYSAGHPIPNNQQDRNTTTLAERLPIIIIRPQTPQNTPADVDLPTRKTRSSPSTRTQALVPSTRKPTQCNEPNLATGDRHQKQQKLPTCSLWKGDPKHSKLSKMRRQRNTQQMKE